MQLLSTDFDGTLHAEYENPSVPFELQTLIGALQAKGMTWVINTGRDLSSLLGTLETSKLSIWPDYIVTVEREIHRRIDDRYTGIEEWNLRCDSAHRELFLRIRSDLPRLAKWIKTRFRATLYEDPYSPLCLIAESNSDADQIQAYLEEYCLQVNDLAFVRNDVYARFSHSAFNKGSALGEIARRLGIGPAHTVAAGDHQNDISMLSDQYARWLIAPSNAIPAVKELVLKYRGFVSSEPYGYGVVEGLKRILNGSVSK